MNQLSLRVDKGQIALPAEVRQRLGLKEGDELLLTFEGNRLILESEAALLNHLYQEVGAPSTNTLVSDELIRERREEAAKE